MAFQTRGAWEAYYIIVPNYFFHLSVIGLDFPPLIKAKARISPVSLGQIKYQLKELCAFPNKMSKSTKTSQCYC